MRPEARILALAAGSWNFLYQNFFSNTWVQRGEFRSSASRSSWFSSPGLERQNFPLWQRLPWDRGSAVSRDELARNEKSEATMASRAIGGADVRDPDELDHF
jgi:hypothetical protein